MSFYPQVSSNTRKTKTLSANQQVDIVVKYRDTSGVNSGTKAVTVDKLQFDLTNGFDEQILSGSVRYTLGNDVFIDRSGVLYRNVDSATGSGTQSGVIQYGTGLIELTSWTPSASNDFDLQSLTTTMDLQPINHISFRTPTTPIRPSSLTLVVASMTLGQLTIPTTENGVIETAQAHGFINYETGFVDVYFYDKTKITVANRAEIEAEDWYSVDLEYEEGGSTYINAPHWIDATSLRYNAIAYTYIPLDADILGLSATRLPSDGRVPIFRVGDIAIVSSSKSFELGAAVAGQTYDLGTPRISYCELEDQNGVKVDYDLYVVNYDYGQVTLGGDFAIGTLVEPLVAKYRYQDMGLVRDVQINGQLTFTKALTHNYDADDTIVGSALVINDMQSRYTAKFVQSTWNSTWSDVASDSAISANYNDSLYPISVTNKGAVDERWALVLTDNTNFRIVGEVSGQIGTGTINADCMPINPVTSAPYFEVKKEGWGSGWASGNVLRFNTVSAMYPVWCIRCVKQSEPTQLSDQFQIMLRGDIDRFV